ncbi:S41 family peptidase [Streptomyces sp. CBMA156]|uniref:S41 family peptidase n=1 Tax=Streptomyces sp. CBMA156 TaxID=1930280 RepID=UPI001661BD63|nr:S41 family peptidase [Streptomyces sp. CBMA156]MBD0676135.1 peptidase S41 [Streptomyces sp. CBMA156]
MTPPGYLRHPHLHGGLLTFTAEDDVWIAPLDADGTGTGRAWRVGCDRTRVSHPRFSPDGTTLAWTSWLGLTPEVWTAPVEGGEASRLSFWGSQDTRVRGWLPDGEVLAVTSYHEPFGHYTWAHALPPDGSPGRRMPWGPVGDAQMSRERTVLLTGAAPHEPAAWKRYRGGATGRLWVDGERILPGHTGHLAAPMPVTGPLGGRIAFLSDHEGIGNVYSCRPDGTDLRRHTDHASYYAREAATDGTRIVYQHAGDLWLLDGLDAPAPRRLRVPLGGARAGRRPYQVNAAGQVKDLACDQTGRAGVITVRGSQYWLTHKDGPARALADTPGVRTRLPVVLGHTGEAAWITDAEGADAIEVVPLPGHAARPGHGERPGSGERPGHGEPPGHPELPGHSERPGHGGPEKHRHRVIAAGRIGRVLELTASPDGSRLAATTSNGRLLLVTAADGEVRELAASGYGPVSSARFSPDSHWIAWSEPVAGRSLRRIRLTRADAPAPTTEITDGRFEDEQPVFTRDGRYLAFLSWRGFDPVHDVHTGDLSFPLGCRPYLVPLAADTPSPFAAPAEDGAPHGDGGGDGTVRVDPAGIGERLLQFPVIASKYSATDAVRGGLVWLRWPISGTLGQTFAGPEDTSGRPALEHFDLARGTRSTLVDRLDGYAVSGDGGSIAVYSAGTLRVIPVAAPAAGTTVDLRRITHTVRPAAEWHQAYHEAARIVRDQFWDERMSGLDWPALVAQYEPLLERVCSPDDFADLLRELLGELGTSHAYVTPSRRAEGPTLSQQPLGLLGANAHRSPDGRWLVDRVLPGETSDPRARAPLAAQGVRDGDEFLEIGGRPVDPLRGPLPLLAGTGGTTLELALRSGQDGPVRRIVISPLTDERPIRYQDWVTKRRSLVREFSDGRCGYLHIPDLGGSGWAQFNRDLRRELDKPALVLDVRGNAGGNVSELVLEKLTRHVLAWDFSRDRRPVRWPRHAPRGPLVALADEATSSDGDVIIAAIKLLGLGPVIGTRTWGGVVGMTGRHTLGDGTQISVPKNASWFSGGLGWSVENQGVEPDVHVLRTPRDWARGRHPELVAAVQLALELLEDAPAAEPPPESTPRPDLRRPPLPPRAR